VNDIKFVINYDYPNSSEDYVHRIGRTARSENTGTAYTFFTTNNAKQANELIHVLQEANQKVHPKLIQLAQSARGFGKGRQRYRQSGSNYGHGSRGSSDGYGGSSRGRSAGYNGSVNDKWGSNKSTSGYNR